MFKDRTLTIRGSMFATVLASLLVPLGAQHLVSVGEARPAFDFQSNPIPRWSNGFLVPIDNLGVPVENPVIHAFDDRGIEGEPLVFSIPGARSILIDAVARGADGRWVLAGRAYDKAGEGGGFVSWLTPDMQKAVTVRTFPYDVQDMIIGPDGTTWTYGPEVTYGAEYDRTPDGVIRRFDRNGKQIGSYLPRVSIREEVGTAAMMDGRIVCNADRVGWYAEQAHEYFELTYNGDKVSRPVTYPGVGEHNDVSVSLMAMAMMDNGDVYVSASHLKPSADEVLYRLDRAHRTWVSVPAPASTNGRLFLLGGDGKRLAFRGEGRIVFAQPSE